MYQGYDSIFRRISTQKWNRQNHLSAPRRFHLTIFRLTFCVSGVSTSLGKPRLKSFLHLLLSPHAMFLTNAPPTPSATIIKIRTSLEQFSQSMTSSILQHLCKLFATIWAKVYFLLTHCHWLVEQPHMKNKKDFHTSMTDRYGCSLSQHINRPRQADSHGLVSRETEVHP